MIDPPFPATIGDSFTWGGKAHASRAATRRRWVRILAVGITVFLDITAVALSANHQVLDAVLGASLATLSWYLLARIQDRRPRPAPTTRGRETVPLRERDRPS
ncbi:hypothetical protein ABIA33_002829 [Streptacidiphilus sp. MAP12-16]|uniref:hypothetical protein n=1 Tax=Streptacidiphilus sp. MAP12-16 TaxID=3156300 RepID=UPI003513546C